MYSLTDIVLLPITSLLAFGPNLKNVEHGVFPGKSEGKIYHIQCVVFCPALISDNATLNVEPVSWYVIVLSIPPGIAPPVLIPFLCASVNSSTVALSIIPFIFTTNALVFEGEDFFVTGDVGDDGVGDFTPF